MNKVEIRQLCLDVLHGKRPKASDVIRLCEMLEDGISPGDSDGDDDEEEDEKDEEISSLKQDRTELRTELEVLRQGLVSDGYSVVDSPVLRRLEEEEEEDKEGEKDDSEPVSGKVVPVAGATR